MTPRNVERRPSGDRGGEHDAGNVGATLRRPTGTTRVHGCRHGCPLGGPHDHDDTEHAPTADVPPCPGWCGAFDVPTRDGYAARYGRCPCLVPIGVR